MSHNTDELVAPKWLDNKYFEKILKSCENDSHLVIKSISIGSASIKGEHFASIIFRVRIQYESASKSRTKSLIVKTETIEEGIKKDMMENRPIFDSEIRMYSKTLPEIQRLLKICGDEKSILHPKLYYHSKTPANVLVLEDLSSDDTINNHKFVVRTKLLCFDESKLIMERLAKWHACSFHMKNNPKFDDEFDKYRYNMFNGVIGDEIITFFKVNMEIFSNEVKKWKDFSDYHENVEDFRHNLVKRGVHAYTPNPKNFGYNVLNHGDLHVKNLMMRLENERMVDFRFVS